MRPPGGPDPRGELPADLLDGETPAPPPGEVRLRLGAEADLWAYQRLLANPFLAALGLAAWAGLTRYAVRSRQLPVFLAALVLLGVCPFLLQFHCRDCGRTGRLRRWRGHACGGVVRRVVGGRPRRFRGPNPYTQTVLWVYAAAAAAVIGYAATRSGREAGAGGRRLTPSLDTPARPFR